MTSYKYAPYPFDEASIAFPADAMKHSPKFEEIPEIFQREEHSACDVANGLFLGTLSGVVSLRARGDIDPQIAWTHLSCIMRSFEPKHEHKMAIWGFLLNEWFTHFMLDDKVVWKAEDGEEEEK